MKGQECKWLNAEIKSEMKSRDQLHRKAQKSRRFVLKELKALKRQKAPGIDELPPGLLKDCADIIAGPLAYIINLSIKTSTVPSAWKIAKINTNFQVR